MELGRCHRDGQEDRLDRNFLVPCTTYVYATTLHGSKLQAKELVYGIIYTKVTIIQNLGNANAHAHYHPCNEYRAVFPLPLARSIMAWGRG